VFETESVGDAAKNWLRYDYLRSRSVQSAPESVDSQSAWSHNLAGNRSHALPDRLESLILTLPKPAVELTIRPATTADAPAIAAIYNQGIADRTSTFESEPRSAEDRLAWLESHGERYPVIVAEVSGDVVGWAAVSPYSPRECYRGIGELSIYVDRDRRGQRVGARLMEALVARAANAGFWKLIGRVFAFNAASLALCHRHGFREVGTHERHARLDGRWIDVVIVERLIPANQD
jgi:L-amino acid N-acyltransferase YncA